MPRTLSATQAFLAPLSKMIAGTEVEGHVIWWEDGQWAAQDDTTELLDAEEVGFYAEGLLAEGFGLTWQVLADAAYPGEPAVALLFFWQGRETPSALPVQDGWQLCAEATWPGKA